MVVSATRAWTVLRTIPADQWIVGDLNARYCAPILTTVVTQANAPSISTTKACESLSVDCTQDPVLKGFGL